MIQPQEANSAPTETGPAWEIARLFPDQGSWSEEDYFWLDNVAGGRVEFSDGCVEVLPMPSEAHQLIGAFLFKLLEAFVSTRNLGLVLYSGLRVRLRPEQIREPDVVFLSKDNYHRRTKKYWLGADFAIEVVSEDAPDRDYVKKKAEYAAGGINEYWIVDPSTRRVTVLTLPADKKEYATAGEYSPGQRAASVLLPGFEIDVTATFDAANV